jgi:hypothetical protein
LARAPGDRGRFGVSCRQRLFYQQMDLCVEQLLSDLRMEERGGGEHNGIQLAQQVTEFGCGAYANLRGNTLARRRLRIHDRDQFDGRQLAQQLRMDAPQVAAADDCDA